MARNSASRVPARASDGSGPGKTIRCAIYTRKSTEEGLQQEFNSLDAQREASEAFIASQKQEGWQVITDHFDDGGYTGGNVDRPALKRLLAAVETRSIDCIVVYKVDRLSRSLLDFARIIEVFDQNGVSFVAVTQQFNTTSSLGRLTLNILLSFAQFEREIISERTRDKMSAARRKGKWIGGHPVLGYDIDPKGGRIIVNPTEAEQVRTLFGLYMTKGSTLPVLQETQRVGLVSKHWTTEDGKVRGGKPFTRGSLHATLTNVLYTGMVDHKGVLYAGEHDRIIDQDTWDRVHEILQRNGNDKGATVRNNLGALLRGLLFCVPCGAPMMHTYTMRKSKRYRYYVCYNAQQQGWQNCDFGAGRRDSGPGQYPPHRHRSEACGGRCRRSHRPGGAPARGTRQGTGRATRKPPAAQPKPCPRGRRHERGLRRAVRPDRRPSAGDRSHGTPPDGIGGGAEIV
jgi:site-specific DNA recombinase